MCDEFGVCMSVLVGSVLAVSVRAVFGVCMSVCSVLAVSVRAVIGLNALKAAGFTRLRGLLESHTLAFSFHTHTHTHTHTNTLTPHTHTHTHTHTHP